MGSSPSIESRLPQTLNWGINGAARNDCNTECEDFQETHQEALGIWREGLELEKKSALTDEGVKIVYDALQKAQQARHATWDTCGGRMDVAIDSTRPCPISGKLCEIRSTLGKLSSERQ